MFVFRPSIVDLFPRLFGFSSVYLDIILLLLYMMTSNTDDHARFVPNRSSPTSAHGLVPHLPPDDPTSASYIPRGSANDSNLNHRPFRLHQEAELSFIYSSG